jgi:hypothetical protein
VKLVALAYRYVARRRLKINNHRLQPNGPHPRSAEIEAVVHDAFHYCK